MNTTKMPKLTRITNREIKKIHSDWMNTDESWGKLIQSATQAQLSSDKKKIKTMMQEIEKQGFEKGVQAVIDYLKNEITTQDKRTAGEPNIKAHLNAVESCVLQTVINALEEWQSLKQTTGAR